MVMRWTIFILLLCSACQTGLIPCPAVKPEKMKRSHARQAVYSPKLVTASVKEEKTKEVSYTKRRPETRPALEHIDVEEWDCPKPGQKKMPKAVRDNIKKNKRAYESHYRVRHSSDSTALRSSSY